MKIFLFLTLLTFISGAPLLMAVEKGAESLEIPAEQQEISEEARESAPEEIREEEKPLIPEIPRRAKETGLSALEKQKLDELERKRAFGKITETEYQMEKDSVVREANVRF